MRKEYAMEFKKILSAGLVVLGISFSFSAHAFIANSDLTIVNDTNHDSTSIINNGLCSTILGDSGVTKAHSTNVVKADILKKACYFSQHNCQADVYMTNNCSGTKIATVFFDIATGVKGYPDVFDKSYTITASGFGISLAGGN
jgi:hypothetical protein